MQPVTQTRRVGVIAPAVGTLFAFRGRQYRVTAWACTSARPQRDPSDPDSWLDVLLHDVATEREGKRHRFCLRPEATHVIGAGVAGCLAAIREIKVVGMADWSVRQLQGATRAAEERGRAGRLIL